MADLGSPATGCAAQLSEVLALLERARHLFGDIVIDPPGAVGVPIMRDVKLPGGQYRKRAELAHAHTLLRAIAAGEINTRELPDNQTLLANHERELPPVTAAVFHLPTDRIGPRSAA